MKAIYYQDDKTKITLDVLTDHKNGTVDLGREKEVLVSKCRVSDKAEPGAATLATEAVASDKKEDKKDEKK